MSERNMQQMLDDWRDRADSSAHFEAEARKLHLELAAEGHGRTKRDIARCADEASVLLAKLREVVLDRKDILKRLDTRLSFLQAWLAEHAPECDLQQKHLDEESTERKYWHYGYMVALRDALKLLSADELDKLVGSEPSGGGT